MLWPGRGQSDDDEDLGGEWQHEPSSPGRSTYKSPTAITLARMCIWKEAQDWAVVGGRKWMGAHATGACWAPKAVHWNGSSFSLHIGPLDGGQGTRGSTFIESSHYTGLPIGWLKANGATRQECAAVTVQFTRIDDFIACWASTKGPHRVLSMQPACQNHPGVGMVDLNCLEELKIRPTWTTRSSLKWEAGQVLAALFTLPTVALCAILSNFLFIYFLVSLIN